MSRNRKKHVNPIEVGSMFRVGVIAVIMAAVFLSYVYSKHQFHQQGNRKVGMEQTLAALRLQNQGMSAQIASLTSRSSLQRRFEDGTAGLRPIASAAIVRVSRDIDAAPAAEPALLPVVNQVALK